MDKQEVFDSIRRIHQLCLVADPKNDDPKDEFYVWKILGMIQGISEYALEKEARSEDDKRNAKND